LTVARATVAGDAEALRLRRMFSAARLLRLTDAARRGARG
jgi:hypothetical protein